MKTDDVMLKQQSIWIFIANTLRNPLIQVIFLHIQLQQTGLPPRVALPSIFSDSCKLFSVVSAEH